MTRIIKHEIMVSGPRHDVEMILCVRVSYDQEGKAAAIAVEPDDTDLFDYVLNRAWKVWRRARKSEGTPPKPPWRMRRISP